MSPPAFPAVALISDELWVVVEPLILLRPAVHGRTGRPRTSAGRHRWVVERTIGWLLSYKRRPWATTAPR